MKFITNVVNGIHQESRLPVCAGSLIRYKRTYMLIDIHKYLIMRWMSASSKYNKLKSAYWVKKAMTGTALKNLKKMCLVALSFCRGDNQLKLPYIVEEKGSSASAVEAHFEEFQISPFPFPSVSLPQYSRRTEKDWMDCLLSVTVEF